MILHVTFSDRSNPWVSFPTDRHTVNKQWRSWVKNHPSNAQPEALCNGWRCYYSGGDYIVYNVDGWLKGYNDTLHKYKHLGHALRALERLGGETR